jgi:hypothetical protein
LCERKQQLRQSRRHVDMARQRAEIVHVALQLGIARKRSDDNRPRRRRFILALGGAFADPEAGMDAEKYLYNRVSNVRHSTLDF